MIQVVCFDLDDTLLRRDKTVSDFTVRTLQQCREKGIKTMIASGRGESAKALVPFGLFDAQVLMNGAVAFADGRRIFEKTVPPECYVPFLMRLEKAGILASVEIGGVHYSNFDVPEREHVLTDFIGLTENSEKLYAIVDSPQKADFVRSNLPDGVYAHFTRDNYALITHAEAVKTNAIAAVLAHWGIPFAGVAAFGDDLNDTDMLKICGIGVAMENALDEVKAVADEICGDCDEDGVAKWLAERIL
jgi:Cof subfamily protein (haloacid dehalogenase superfamily)